MRNEIRAQRKKKRGSKSLKFTHVRVAYKVNKFALIKSNATLEAPLSSQEKFYHNVMISQGFKIATN